MTRVWPFSIGFLLPPVIFVSLGLGGWWVWLPVALMYVGLPIADRLTPLNPTAHSAEDTRRLISTMAFRRLTWCWVPVHVVTLMWALWTFTSQPLSYVEAVGLIMSVGTIAGGIGITYAHELIHRTDRFELMLGDVLLALVTYPHFAIEHVYGHHRHVATPLDPASARQGEGIYAFLLRAITGGLAHAWHIEVTRVHKLNVRSWSFENRMITYVRTVTLVYLFVGVVFGLRGMLFFAAQSFVAVVMLEAINYVEHYGLTRRELSPGQFERVSPRHSWDSNHRVSNWLLINLARHSDHHLLASKRYQALNSIEASPQLPAGYGTMLLVALVPPLWRHLMDRRIPSALESPHQSQRDGDVTTEA